MLCFFRILFVLYFDSCYYAESGVKRIILSRHHFRKKKKKKKSETMQRLEGKIGLLLEFDNSLIEINIRV